MLEMSGIILNDKKINFIPPHIDYDVFKQHCHKRFIKCEQEQELFEFSHKFYSGEDKIVFTKKFCEYIKEKYIEEIETINKIINSIY